MTELSREEIEAIKVGCAGVTPGPWYVTGLPWFQTGSGVLAGSPDPHAGFLIFDCEVWEGERDEYRDNGGGVQIADPDKDAAHIARLSPEVVTALCDRALQADALERERDEARTEMDSAHNALTATDRMVRKMRERAEAAEAQLASAEEKVRKLMEALKSTREAFRAEYSTDGRVLSVSYDDKALRPMILALDAALSQARGEEA